MKHLNESAIRYMRSTWGFETSGEVDDIAMFWSYGEYELVAKRLVDAGAVYPNCPEAKALIKVAKSITDSEEDEIIAACLKTHTILECTECNYTHFIPDWCVVNDWVAGGCQSCGRKHACVVSENNVAKNANLTK